MVNNQTPNEQLDNHWYWGKTGTGKSYTAR